MKLTARQVDTAKPTEKPYKLSDGGGLYLEAVDVLQSRNKGYSHQSGQ